MKSTTKSIYIPPLDDAAKRQLLKAVAECGQAAGLEAAAEMLTQMTEAHTGVVGTNTIKDAARAMRDKAHQIRRVADGKIRDLEVRYP